MKRQTHNCGFSTLELLITFAVMTLSITAVILVAFGNQSNAIDTELAQRGLYLAQTKLEEAGAQTLAPGGFNSVASDLIPVAEAGTPYETQITVSDISECAKRITADSFWNRDLRSLKSSLTGIFVSPEASAAVGGDCATEEAFGWEAPKFYDNPDVIHPGSQASDVDVIKNDRGTFALMTSNKVPGQGTFWVVDITDPDNPVTIGEFDTDDDNFSIDAYSDDLVSYAFLASASSTAQLQVIEVDFTAYPGINPTLSRGVAQLPGVSGSDPEGRAVSYFDERVYIGTRRTAGDEFHIFDVSTPLSPSHLGSIELNHSVNDIDVMDDEAFLATSAQTAQGCELIVVDVSNPGSLANPCYPGSTDGVMSYRAPGNHDGMAVDASSNRVYLGRQQAGSDHDFYILNTSDLNAIASLGSMDLDLNSNTEVIGVIRSGDLAFVATSDQTPANGGGPFMVYDISDPSSISLVSTCAINFSEVSTGLDFLDNTVYVSNAANDALRILYPSPICS